MKQKNVEKILKKTIDIYDAIASDFSNTRNKQWQGFNDFNKYVKAGDKILDLGCGNGRLANIFIDSQVEYLGIDNSAELIKIAKQRLSNKSWVKFEIGDAINLHFNNQFDLVLMIAVLHHVPTKELRLKILKNIYKALKPGGKLIISNWNLWQINGEKKKFRYFKHLFNYKDKINHKIWRISDAFIPWKPLAKNNLRYVHSFRKREIKKLLQRAGFSIQSLGFKSKKNDQATILTGENLLVVAVKK